MSFHQMSGRPVEPNGQSAETEWAPVGIPDQYTSRQRQESPQDSLEKLDDYIAYAEMKDLQYEIGELLHRIVDACILLSIGPQESSRN